MDKEEKRIEIAVDAVKQQITISAAVIAFVATLAGTGSDLREKLAWVMVPLLISITCGVFTLLAIPWALYSDHDPFSQVIVRAFGVIQPMAFIVGLFTVWKLA